MYKLQNHVILSPVYRSSAHHPHTHNLGRTQPSRTRKTPHNTPHSLQLSIKDIYINQLSATDHATTDSMPMS